jgi:hypothetical protein
VVGSWAQTSQARFKRVKTTSEFEDRVSREIYKMIRTILAASLAVSLLCAATLASAQTPAGGDGQGYHDITMDPPKKADPPKDPTALKKEDPPKEKPAAPKVQGDQTPKGDPIPPPPYKGVKQAQAESGIHIPPSARATQKPHLRRPAGRKGAAAATSHGSHKPAHPSSKKIAAKKTTGTATPATIFRKDETAGLLTAFLVIGGLATLVAVGAYHKPKPLPPAQPAKS